MEEKSFSGKEEFKWPRYPPTAAGIRVNHCKSPTCKNVGILPRVVPKRGAPPKGSTPKVPTLGDYIVVASGKGNPALKCSLDLPRFHGRFKGS